MKTTEDILMELQAASTDLYWMSEGDYPFELISWPVGKIDELGVRTELHLAAEVSIKVFTLTELWEQVAEEEEFIELRLSIVGLLTDIQVFRVGEVEVDIYIVGYSPLGERLGLTTRSIET